MCGMIATSYMRTAVAGTNTALTPTEKPSSEMFVWSMMTSGPQIDRPLLASDDFACGDLIMARI